MVKGGVDHHPVVILTKDNMDAYKPVPVVILPPVRFIYRQTSKVTKGIIQGVWDPEIPVAVITMVWIPVEEALADIGMKTRNVVIHT